MNSKLKIDYHNDYQTNDSNTLPLKEVNRKNLVQKFYQEKNKTIVYQKDNGLDLKISIINKIE